MVRTFLIYFFCFAILFGMQACGGGSSGQAPAASGSDPQTDPVDPVDPSPVQPARESNASCIPPEPQLQGGTPSFAARFQSLPVVSFAMAMVQPLNDSSFWLLVARNGEVYRFDNTPEVSELRVVLDISARVSTVLEKGLSGAAFHPNYPSDPRLFLLYNDSDNEGRSTLSSFTVNTSDGMVDESSERVLLTLPQEADNHNGGDMAFGPDGMLYAAFGDDEKQDQAQSAQNLWGTLIRIDVSSATGYTVPSDNPFIGAETCPTGISPSSSNCPEVFALGFRNPWRFSIDSQTGSPWVADVGEESFEEVNRVVSGGNYGWPIMEGPECTNTCDTSSFDLPIASYGRDQGVSVYGGYVYRGADAPSLNGQYIFGDIYNASVYAVAADASPGTEEVTLFSTLRVVPAMAEGNDGEIYFLNAQADGPGDMIFQLTEEGGSAQYSMPEQLSNTGCFNPLDKTSTTGVFEYDNINPLWSDGADKLRSFAIPDNTTISVLPDGEFRFPDDSVLIKHFLAGERYIETRLLVKHPGGWQGYTYEWNDAETEANLLDSGFTKDVGSFIHTYPSPSQCGNCHIGSDASLGLEALQLNRSSEALEANFIDYLSEAGYFTSDQDSTLLPSLVALDDSTASIADRARSYLHSNCSGCHRPGTGNRVDLDLRFTTDFASTNTCGLAPALGDLGVSGAQIIQPGNADASVLVLRMEAESGSGRMPPLASLVEDTAATAVIREWINGLSSCD